MGFLPFLDAIALTGLPSWRESVGLVINLALGFNPETTSTYADYGNFKPTEVGFACAAVTSSCPNFVIHFLGILS
ncbi:hypothetical protein [Dolichospermum flos-aquae]|uniref:Uncharacterized protein n=1 Tax=Dolichospermum flos-aquae CCAP 1403/13F TaxID=315271 RepID=A0A6H2BTW6_DOLFA|nr:hypothetical protein [Dolichospermum flos-aquae]QJB43032.1 hypothetical protein HGD76_01020 [Dolichospermum flos-aquae CCAP 1403/13F]